jgi:hypothetical protein
MQFALAHTEIDHVYFNKDQFNQTDIFYMSGYAQTVAELKTRDYSYTQTWNGTPNGWIFEKGKWNEFKAINKTAHTYSAYINIFQDAMVIWDLTFMKEEDFEWRWKKCQKNHLCKEKVWKEVCYLPVSKASHIYLHQFKIENTKHNLNQTP